MTTTDIRDFTGHTVDPDHGRELQRATDEYALLLGWPVSVDGDRVVLKVNEGVSALSMRAGWGGEVQWFLQLRMLAGPVVAIPGPVDQWVFLTKPPDIMPTPCKLPACLNLVREQVVLPPTRTDIGEVRWATEPAWSSDCLPPFYAVVNATRSLTSQGRF